MIYNIEMNEYYFSSGKVEWKIRYDNDSSEVNFTRYTKYSTDDLQNKEESFSLPIKVLLEVYKVI